MKIVVACGGTSPEREVSLNSGEAVANALKGIGIEVIKEDVKSPKDFFKKWNMFAANGVYLALHGGWGENGLFQAGLELFDIPYTGSGPEASMYAMDKSTAKLFFVQNNINTPEGFSLIKDENSIGQAINLLEKHGTIIVKPNSGGSTVGVTTVAKKEEILDALKLAWESEDKALIEAFIPGKETTVSVWEKEDGEVVAFPAIEIRPKEGFYDYTNKYTHGNTDYLCPASFSNDITEKLEEMAISSHKSLGCRGYSRVDFRITDEGKIFALEVNSAPGMTSTSLMPMAAAAYGMDFPQYLSRTINISFKINRQKYRYN